MARRWRGLFGRDTEVSSPERLSVSVSALGTVNSEIGAATADGLILPDDALLKQLVQDLGLSCFVDDDGDLGVRWEHCSIYFFYYGTKREVLQARMYLNRRFDVQVRPAVAMALDDWNRTKLCPKAYTVLPDDGLVGICAEQCYDFELGATREQIAYTVGVWLDTLLKFAQWVDEHIWVPDAGEESTT